MQPWQPCPFDDPFACVNATQPTSSRIYDLPRWLRLHPAQSTALKNSSKVQADLFEAYLGGIYLDKGFGDVQWWLAQVMRPLIRHAYNYTREEHGLVQKSVEEMDTKPDMASNATMVSSQTSTQTTSTVGHLSIFHQHCQQTGKDLRWKYCDVPEGTKTTPIWSVDAFVDGEYVGMGKGNTKKVARNEAAKQGLKFLGIVVP